ncbi:MAG: GNAT family N-acetyltransferase [Bacteroidota bacterium]|jgi:GNAT superfamily N-acetyltransferase|nr:GNAT family N-acetyltransferase [Bacteroidota bacterium]
MIIRRGTINDLEGVYNLIIELAHFERAPEEVENTLEKMKVDGFGKNPIFEFYIAEQDNEIIGLALYYFSYSTWKGRAMHLEDLVITESLRKKGLGKLLFDKVVERAKELQVGRLTWQVLDWNEPAIQFYKKVNAQFLNEWITCRLTREQLENYKSSDSSKVLKATN